MPGSFRMIGQTISHYRILEKLGGGGMGVVYRAHDGHLDRDVALKFLPPDLLADPEARAQLLREARTASALNHPNICIIYDVGETGETTYIAMELVPGELLSNLTPAEGFPSETVTRYGAQIADALAHAHSHGIVHRDLKASNIIITPEARAKVLDFGLARQRPISALDEVTRSTASLEQAGPVAGTLPYIAPEILSGEPADVRTDIWSLGVLLYEMAAGHRPFMGKTCFEISSAILRSTPAFLPADSHSGLHTVIGRCLAKDPAQRYQRAGEVRAALEAIGSSSASLQATVQQPASQPAQQTGRHVAHWLSRRGLVWIAGIVLAAVVGLRGWKVLHPRASPSSTITSIAVLPLANLSNDPEQDYFADGMTEAVISDLSRIRALRVISRTSVMQYKNANKPLPQIARELHVDGVVEGSVQRSGGRVKIAAQLIAAREDRNLWANSYEGDLTDVLSLQADVAQAIAREIQVQLSPEENSQLVRHRPVNSEAYQAYLKGRYYWNKRTPDDLRKSIDLFKRAIELEPANALAQAGLADGYLLLSIYALERPRDAMPLAKAAATRALALDNSLAEAHATLAIIEWNYEWDAAVADREFEHALALNPNYAQAHQWYAIFLSNCRRHDEAIAESRRAQELDPLSTIIEVNVAAAYYTAQRHDEAARRLEQLVSRQPDFWPAHIILGETYLAAGRLDEATQELKRAQDLLPGNPRSTAVLAVAYARDGRLPEARRLRDELVALSQKTYVPSAYIAIADAGLGEKDQAFTWLDKAFVERSDWVTYLASEPLFDPLRDDPRFAALLRRAGSGSL